MLAGLELFMEVEASQASAKINGHKVSSPGAGWYLRRVPYVEQNACLNNAWVETKKELCLRCNHKRLQQTAPPARERVAQYRLFPQAVPNSTT